MNTALFFPGCHSSTIVKPAVRMLPVNIGLVNDLTYGRKPSLRPTGNDNKNKRKYHAKSPRHAVLETKIPPGLSNA